MKFKIRHVQNGAVLRVEPQTPAEETEEVVHQETGADELEAFADFLRYLADHYGPHTSRYSPKRIYIRLEPGDKCEVRPSEEQTLPCRSPSIHWVRQRSVRLGRQGPASAVSCRDYFFFLLPSLTPASFIFFLSARSILAASCSSTLPSLLASYFVVISVLSFSCSGVCAFFWPFAALTVTVPATRSPSTTNNNFFIFIFRLLCLNQFIPKDLPKEQRTRRKISARGYSHVTGPHAEALPKANAPSPFPQH